MPTPAAARPYRSSLRRKESGRLVVCRGFGARFMSSLRWPGNHTIRWTGVNGTKGSKQLLLQVNDWRCDTACECEKPEYFDIFFNEGGVFLGPRRGRVALEWTAGVGRPSMSISNPPLLAKDARNGAPWREVGPGIPALLNSGFPSPSAGRRNQRRRLEGDHIGRKLRRALRVACWL